ncbi:LacI family DNA-binding transcriptional regulator [Dactylosporangium sp. NPDC049742]|uniref:LacI family DNA-binding transcriptional regulator n=1 Tax=Dactylosporangium sp. NPDC049742 TaxID=3154737 RepID=UPI00341216AF
MNSPSARTASAWWGEVVGLGTQFVRLAGVSIGTVADFLHHPGRVAAGTQERIAAAIGLLMRPRCRRMLGLRRRSGGRPAMGSTSSRAWSA